MSEDARRRREGTAYGFLAYLIWGAFPFYFATLRPAGPWEILSHRILWTLAVCGLVLLLTRDLRWLFALARTPRRLGGLMIAGLLIAVNWGVYTYAVLSGHITEAALGYFLNPLVTVALGVVILRERLRRLQWVAVGVGVVAAVYLTVDYGQPPWISFVLAASFALYSLAKNRLGVSLSPFRSLFAESLTVTPLAIGILVWLSLSGATTFGGYGGGHTLLLMSTGVATAIPLLLFAAAASRIPLSRWVGFVMVWLALVVLSVDMVRQVRHSHRDRASRRRAADGAATGAAPPGAPGPQPPHP